MNKIILINIFLLISTSFNLKAGGQCELMTALFRAEISNLMSHKSLEESFPNIPSDIRNNVKYTFLKDISNSGDILRINALNNFFKKILFGQYKISMDKIIELANKIEEIHITRSMRSIYTLSELNAKTFTQLSEVFNLNLKKETDVELAALLTDLSYKKKAIGYIRSFDYKRLRYHNYKDIAYKVKTYENIKPLSKDPNFKQFPEEVKLAGKILTEKENFPDLVDGEYIALIYKINNGKTKIVYSRRSLINRMRTNEEKFFVSHQALYNHLLNIYGPNKKNIITKKNHKVNILGVIRINALNSRITNISSYSLNFPGSTEQHLYNSLAFLKKKGLSIEPYTQIYNNGEKQKSHSRTIERIKLIKKYFSTEIFAKYKNLYLDLYKRFPSLEHPGQVSLDLLKLRYIEIKTGEKLFKKYELLDSKLNNALEYFENAYNVSYENSGTDAERIQRLLAIQYLKTMSNEGISFAIKNKEKYFAPDELTSYNELRVLDHKNKTKKAENYIPKLLNILYDIVNNTPSDWYKGEIVLTD